MPHQSRPAVREHLARQSDNELREFIHLAVDSDRSPMLFRHDVVGDRQAKAGALAGWLGGEEWLEQLVPDLGGKPGPFPPHRFSPPPASAARSALQHRREPGAPAVT